VSVWIEGSARERRDCGETTQRRLKLGHCTYLAVATEDAAAQFTPKSLSHSLRPDGSGGRHRLGTVGFSLIEGWSIPDSLYVTVQTLTTVGYGDEPPRSGAAVCRGRCYAARRGRGCLCRLNHSSISGPVGVESRLSVSDGAPKRMSKLQDHLIICGSGRVAGHLIRIFLDAKETFVVIESDPNVLESSATSGVHVHD